MICIIWDTTRKPWFRNRSLIALTSSSCTSQPSISSLVWKGVNSTRRWTCTCYQAVKRIMYSCTSRSGIVVLSSSRSLTISIAMDQPHCNWRQASRISVGCRIRSHLISRGSWVETVRSIGPWCGVPNIEEIRYTWRWANQNGQSIKRSANRRNRSKSGTLYENATTQKVNQKANRMEFWTLLQSKSYQTRRCFFERPREEPVSPSTSGFHSDSFQFNFDRPHLS